MGEHVLKSTVKEDRVEIKKLYDSYLSWCKFQEIERPAVAQLGKIVSKMFNSPTRKPHQYDGESSYYYKQLLYVTEKDRDGLGNSIKILSYMSMSIEHDIVCFTIPTAIVFDGAATNFKVFYNSDSYRYWMTFREVALEMKEVGIGEYAVMDQMFMNSINRMASSFVICQGRQVVLPEGKAKSKNLIPAMFAYMGSDGEGSDTKEIWVSKNCKGVLPMTCSIKNKICSVCVHDINQHIRYLKAGGFLTKEEAEFKIKYDAFDTETYKNLVEFIDNLNVVRSDDADLPDGRFLGGSCRRRSETEGDDDNSSKIDTSASSGLSQVGNFHSFPSVNHDDC